ncbi:DUF4394 domain-containing protein [Sulfitobacter guttiformis]|uniref:Uncharacterized protein DUF4394 n=1 Tax=Sulfitobacter guttiformis TaxID=74349 RepID=A0A420DIP8_9RHOB|nr:DUF4394 domain-containing protein [Sulfitobacter guttiformis]KIN72132.1 hypothetical protein Z949_1301 [Sulfitobacter guttiformis KCTC 32187]RKE94092.1 uncharacterized protein DUF4394 [Sulfitobacter guttiformis]
MTFKTVSTATFLSLAAGSAFAAGHATTTGYGLIDEGSAIVVFTDMASPAGATKVVLTGGTVDAIAYRPVTGDLVGFSKAGMIYTIDPQTGALTDTGATFGDDVTMADDAAVALDFNNAIDAVRAVSSDGVNVVYFPKEFADERANTVKRFTDLAYAEGDVNAGATPLIFANAYTNAVNGAKQETTAQYAIDAGLDALVTLANNEGTLATVAPLTLDGAPFDVSDMGGFDIISAAAGEDTAIALLGAEGSETSGIYQIDLATGAATLMGDTGMGGFSGFAAKIN